MQRPLIFAVSSPGGVFSLPMMTFPRSAKDGSVFVQMSHASPSPSLSLSA
jgi:hypothetical protein